MANLEINSHRFKLSSGWNELSPEAVLCLAKCIIHERSYAELRLRLLLEETKIKVFKRSPKGYLLELPDGEKAMLRLIDLSIAIQCYEWLFEPARNGKREMSRGLLKQHFPVLIVGKQNWYGPGDAMGNLCYDQVIMADHLLWRFSQDKKEATMWQFFCVFYQAKPYSEGFSDDDLEERAILAKKHLGYEMVMATWLMYSAFQAIAEKRFPEVYSGPEARNKKNQKAQDPFWSGQAVIDLLAEGRVAEYPKVRSAKAWDVLNRMKQARIDAKRLKQHIQKMKRK